MVRPVDLRLGLAVLWLVAEASLELWLWLNCPAVSAVSVSHMVWQFLERLVPGSGEVELHDKAFVRSVHKRGALH